ncbi:epimerase family protein SDR39U1-like protein [Leptotrombidium deliense]|uniref:Epimerase family protein SDR39U1-like protein n=1 Tax=Leptotrombidium deliense TaxID=299467 RepID=A0A443SJV0_9ACAR|nr:epimerase family protein SDR39U1-like protein [Leptotrombidium deliense]
MQTRFSTVLIGGGTGFIGSRLKNAFSPIADKVILVSRNNAKDCLTWDHINKNGIPKGTDLVINVAGENVLNPFRYWSTSFKENVISSRVQTNKCLATAIQKCENGPRAFITISGVNYYRPNGEEQTEYNQVSSFDFFSKLCEQWETAGNIEKSGTRRVIIRCGVVLGSEGGMIANIKIPFKLGLGGIIGCGKQLMPWIHAHDLSQLFVFAACNERVNGVLNGVAPLVITNYDFTKAFGKSLQRPTLIPFPAFAVKLVFGTERSDMLLKGPKVIPRRVQELNFKYKYANIEAACNELVNSSFIKTQ